MGSINILSDGKAMDMYAFGMLLFYLGEFLMTYFYRYLSVLRHGLPLNLCADDTNLLVYFAVSGSEGWANTNSMVVMYKLGTDPDMRPSFPKQMPQQQCWLPIQAEVIALVRKCWTTEPPQRPPFDEVAAALGRCFDKCIASAMMPM